MTITWARRIRTAAAAALLLAAAVACGNGSGGASDGASDLDGRTFAVTSVEVDGEQRSLVESTSIVLTFEDGGVRANAGCNHLGAEVTIESDRLVVTDMTTTDMGCAPSLMEQDAWLMGLLMGDPSWALEGSTLTLATDDTTVVLVDATATTPATELVGTTWILDTIVDGSAAMNVPGVTATLDFSADGSVVSRGTCNGYSATFESGPDTIVFEPGPTTLIGCPEPQATVEDAIRRTLTGTTTYSIEGQRLTVTSTDGSQGLVYRVET